MFQKNGEKARFRSTQNPIKITVRKSLKIKYHFSAKIQGIYFKIQGTYFKISALYFSPFQAPDKQQLTKSL